MVSQLELSASLLLRKLCFLLHSCVCTAYIVIIFVVDAFPLLQIFDLLHDLEGGCAGEGVAFFL